MGKWLDNYLTSRPGYDPRPDLVPWTLEWLNEYHKRKGQPLAINPRKLTPRRQKQRQLEHQRGLCCWCLKPMQTRRRPSKHNGDHGPLYATWEHIIPVSHGGTDALINLVLAHSKCNNERGNQPCRTPHFQSYTVAQTFDRNVVGNK